MAAELAVMTQLRNDIATLQESVNSLSTVGSQIKNIWHAHFPSRYISSTPGETQVIDSVTSTITTPITNIDKVVYHITPTSELASNEAAPDTSIYPYRFFDYDRSDIFVHPLTKNLGDYISASNVSSGNIKFKVLSSDHSAIVGDYTANRIDTDYQVRIGALTLTIIEYA